jgi:hypothetical protein
VIACYNLASCRQGVNDVLHPDPPDATDQGFPPEQRDPVVGSALPAGGGGTGSAPSEGPSGGTTSSPDTTSTPASTALEDLADLIRYYRATELGATWLVSPPPPVIKQVSFTCWAAALASAIDAVVSNFTERYEGTDCIDRRNGSLWAENIVPVMRQEGWGTADPDMRMPDTVDQDVMVDHLTKYGRVILVNWQGSPSDPNSWRHTRVVYDVGWGEDGYPDGKTFWVMDPLSGLYDQVSYASLQGSVPKIFYPDADGATAPCFVRKPNEARYPPDDQ